MSPVLQLPPLVLVLTTWDDACMLCRRVIAWSRCWQKISTWPLESRASLLTVTRRPPTLCTGQLASHPVNPQPACSTLLHTETLTGFIVIRINTWVLAPVPALGAYSHSHWLGCLGQSWVSQCRLWGHTVFDVQLFTMCPESPDSGKIAVKLCHVSWGGGLGANSENVWVGQIA